MTFAYNEAGSTGTSSSTSSSQSGTLPWYNQYVQDLLARGQNLQAPGVYTGERVAGFTPDQQSAFNMARGNVGNWQPYLQQSQGALSQALGGLSNLQQSPYTQGALLAYSQAVQGSQFDPNQLDKFRNPYINNVVNEISRLGNENFQNNILSGINSNFSDAGQFGSARQMAMTSDAAAKAQREISAAQGQALFDTENAAMGQYGDWANRGTGALQTFGQANLNINDFLRGVGTDTAQASGYLSQLGQMTQNLGQTDVNALLAMGNQQQQQQQNVLGANQAQFQEQQTQPWNQLNQWANLFKVPTPQQSTSTANSTSNNTSTNWQTNFRKGGLATLKKYADGGMFEDDEDLVSSQLGANNVLRHMLGNSRQVPVYPPEVAQSIRNEPSLGEIPEESFAARAGEAMMRSAAQGPAHWGELLGRSGANYFDKENERQKQNYLRALKKQELLTEASKRAVIKDSSYAMSKFGKIAVEMGYEPGTPEFAAKVEELMASGKTVGELSVPGKIARDEGLQPGTPEFGNRVRELHKFEQDVKSQGLDIRANTAETYAGNLGARRSEQTAKFGDMPGTSSKTGGSRVSAPTAKIAGETVPVTGEFVKSHVENLKDISRIADPEERAAATAAYESQRSENFSRHPGVLKFVNQGLPIKSALDRFETEGKEYDKLREELNKGSEPLSIADFDRAFDLNERIKKSSGPGTGFWYDVPGVTSVAATVPNEYGAAVGELRSLGTKMIPALTKGLTPVSNADMQAMSKAGFGPEQGYAINKANIQRAKSAVGLIKEYETFLTAAQEMGLDPARAKNEWNKYIKSNPLFDVKKTDKTGVLQYAGDPASRADKLNEFIEKTKLKFFSGLKKGSFSPMSEKTDESTKPEKIVITPEMLQGE